MHAVELRIGPIFAFLVLKTGLFFSFLFLQISFSLQIEEDFSENEENKQTMTDF